MTSEWISVKDLAKLCGVARRTAYAWVYNGYVETRSEPIPGTTRERLMVNTEAIKTVKVTRPVRIFEILAMPVNEDTIIGPECQDYTDENEVGELILGAISE